MIGHQQSQTAFFFAFHFLHTETVFKEWIKDSFELFGSAGIN